MEPHYSPNLPHIKQFKESAALHYFRNFAALNLSFPFPSPPYDEYENNV